jgi:hypothetical protein
MPWNSDGTRSMTDLHEILPKLHNTIVARLTSFHERPLEKRIPMPPVFPSSSLHADCLAAQDKEPALHRSRIQYISSPGDSTHLAFYSLGRYRLVQDGKYSFCL